MDPSSENVFEVSDKKRGRIFLTDEGRDVVNDLNGEPPSLEEKTGEYFVIFVDKSFSESRKMG
jgi:fructose-1-phosphate kinase PfkB-like protein